MNAIRRYYSHRKGFRPPLTGEFWTAFDALLRRLIAESSKSYNKLFGNLLSWNRFDGWLAGGLETAVEERLGHAYYMPFGRYNQNLETEEHVFDYIEVFHDLAQEQYRSKYAEEVNNLFKRFNQPYELIEGSVHYRGSEVLDDPIETLDLITVRDDQVRKYLEAARDAFFDARQDRRLEGLRSLWDAFERVKSLREGNKRDSAAKIVEELAQSEELQPHYDSLFRSLKEIGNKANIRHSEKHVEVIDNDPVIIEHLFYSMWALIRAVLAREDTLQVKEPKPS